MKVGVVLPPKSQKAKSVCFIIRLDLIPFFIHSSFLSPNTQITKTHSLFSLTHPKSNAKGND